MADGSKRLKVALIQGGDSSEREVSLNSGSSVYMALDPLKYQVRIYDSPTDLGRLISDAPALDVAVIMLHGRSGEDGSMQGLLELLKIPYQCSGILGCALTIDKERTKRELRQAGFPLAPELMLKKGEADARDRVLKDFGLPVVVKPNREGSSCGITIVHDEQALDPALELAFSLDERVMVERFVAGREITASVLGNDDLEALPLIEIVPSEKYTFFDYEAKYLPGASQEICPAPLETKATRQIQDLALRAHRLLGLKGYSRSDFILGEKGPVLLEVNTIPGMTATSLFPQAAAAAGYSFPVLMDRLIELALE